MPYPKFDDLFWSFGYFKTSLVIPRIEESWWETKYATEAALFATTFRAEAAPHQAAQAWDPYQPDPAGLFFSLGSLYIHQKPLITAISSVTITNKNYPYCCWLLLAMFLSFLVIDHYNYITHDLSNQFSSIKPRLPTNKPPLVVNHDFITHINQLTISLSLWFVVDHALTTMKPLLNPWNHGLTMA